MLRAVPALADSRIFGRALGRHCLKLLAVCAAVAALAGCDLLLSPDARVERAQSHLEEGEFRAAMVELKTALEKAPDHAQARIMLADLSLWLGDLSAAEKELERAAAVYADADKLRALQYELLLAQERYDEVAQRLESDEATPELRRLLLGAKVEAARGRLPEAQALLQKALALAPDDPEALLEWAHVKAMQHDAQPALELPARIAQTKTAAHAHLLRGQVLMARGDHKGARESFAAAWTARRDLPAREHVVVAAALSEVDLALGDVAAAEQSLAALSQRAPDALITHHLRARVALLKNDAVRAVAETQRALRINPEYVPAQLLLAAAHLSQGSLEQAEDVLTRLLASHPGNPAARKLLAQVYLARNAPERAHGVLEAAPLGGDADADWLMGAALLRAGDGAAGLQYLERSAAAEPDDERRRIDLAGAYIASGAAAKAIELLRTTPADPQLAARAQLLLVMATAIGKPRAEAHREVRELAAAHPDQAYLLSAAGAYFAQSGEAAEARELLTTALKREPASADARLALARLEANTGNVAEAERHLRELLKPEPREQRARIALAELAWNAGDRARARKELEEAVSVEPGAVAARMRLAQIAFLEADGVRARSLLEQAVDVARDRGAALSAAARVLAQAGFADEALAKHRAAAAAGRSQSVLDAARLHLDLGQVQQARDLLDAAIVDRPKWREAHRLLAVVDAREGRVEQALARMKNVSDDLSPAAVHAFQGELYALAGQPAAAIKGLEEAQRLQPSGALAIKLFELRRASGADAAERSLVQWIERKPDDVAVRRVLALQYESTGRQALALPHYEQMLAADAIDPITLNNMAWALHERGDARAPELARRAYTAAPHLAAVADTYGWILVRMGKAQQGLDVLEKALAKAPANPDIRYHAAVAYSKSGQVPKAVEILQGVVRTQEQFMSRTAAEQLLASLTTATM
jgi:putative PEP-CTERM system TPR-repeat lipoprotein